jgi:small subunit ribosomal protein S6
MTNRYEAVIVYDSSLDEQALNAQIQKVEKLIKDHGGAIEQQEIWGRRQLAFKIKKKDSGLYVLLVFNGDTTTISDMERQLKINESVLRHLLVLKDKFAPDFDPNRKLDESFTLMGAMFDPAADLLMP